MHGSTDGGAVTVDQLEQGDEFTASDDRMVFLGTLIDGTPEFVVETPREEFATAVSEAWDTSGVVGTPDGVPKLADLATEEHLDPDPVPIEGVESGQQFEVSDGRVVKLTYVAATPDAVLLVAQYTADYVERAINGDQWQHEGVKESVAEFDFSAAVDELRQIETDGGQEAPADSYPTADALKAEIDDVRNSLDGGRGALADVRSTLDASVETLDMALEALDEIPTGNSVESDADALINTLGERSATFLAIEILSRTGGSFSYEALNGSEESTTDDSETNE